MQFEVNTGRGDTPLVSVIVPAFNAAKFVEATIRSALAQTCADFELIVVNDGSVDDTEAVVSRIAREDARIRLVTQPNGGVATARNRGIAESSGRYLAFLDADDIWYPSKLEEQISAIENAPDPARVGAVYGYFRFIDTDDRVIGNGPVWNVSGRIFYRHLAYSVVGNGSSLLCPRWVVEELGGFDQSLAPTEDQDFELRIAAKYDVLLVPRYLIGYRQHPGAASRNRVRIASMHAKVVEAHKALNGSVPAECERYVRAECLVLLAGAYLRTGSYWRALLFIAALAVHDPRRTAFEVAKQLGNIMRPAGGTGPAYYELDPTPGPDHRPPALLLRRAERLKTLEAGSWSSSSNTSSHQPVTG